MLPYLDGVKNIDILDLNTWYDYGEFQVSIGKLYHDVPNAFFRINKNGYKIFRATDTSHLNGIEAKNYSLYCIESNYNENTIEEQIEKYYHKKGAINTHLSEQQVNEFFYKNKGENSQLIRLHESTST